MELRYVQNLRFAIGHQLQQGSSLIKKSQTGFLFSCTFNDQQCNSSRCSQNQNEQSDTKATFQVLAYKCHHFSYKQKKVFFIIKYLRCNNLRMLSFFLLTEKGCFIMKYLRCNLHMPLCFLYTPICPLVPCKRFYCSILRHFN